MQKEALQRRIDAALGRIPCDLILNNVKFLDVFSCQWNKGSIAVCDGVIVGIEPGLHAKRTIDGKSKALVPGFIDAHVHVESSLLIPPYFEKAVLPRGTTTAICDPHELTNVVGIQGIQYFLEESKKLSLDLRVMLSSCVPATHLETNGGGNIDAAMLLPLLSHPKALGLAEMMNVPGVLNKKPDVLEKLITFSHVPIDGHCPKVSGQNLSAYAATGISSCHESVELSEAKEKLTKGIAVWIREGSVAKNLKDLIPLLNPSTSPFIGFCTDDRNPLDIAQEGHIDFLVKGAIAAGVLSETVYRSASLSVARHYGLKNIGAIAPGYQADFILLEDVSTCAIHSVYKNGKLASELETKPITKHEHTNTVKAKTPEAKDLEGPKGRVHVMGVKSGSIYTERLVLDSEDNGIAKLSVLERYGRGSKPANAYVSGFGKNLSGAIASSVGHDSHNLIVVGKNTKDMRVALACLIESGGGFCVVQNEKIVETLPLPFGGLMSFEEPRSVEKQLRKMRQASHFIGCELPEPFLQLAFLCLPVIPSLKLTDKGLVDVDRFQFIDVRVS